MDVPIISEIFVIGGGETLPKVQSFVALNMLKINILHVLLNKSNTYRDTANKNREIPHYFFAKLILNMF